MKGGPEPSLPAGKKKNRGPAAACGRDVQKLSAGERVCYACGREGSGGRWKHIGSGPYWDLFPEWAKTGDGWAFGRDLVKDAMVPGECVCARSDCVLELYRTFQRRTSKHETGSWGTMLPGQRSPLGRYASMPWQVRDTSAQASRLP